MQRKGHPPVSGVLYFGINARDNARDEEIYHLCFEEKHAVFMRRFDVFTGPSIDPLNIAVDQDSNPEEHVGTYNVTVSEEAVLKFSYPARGSSLEVFPLRTDLLPPIFQKKISLPLNQAIKV